MERLLERFLRYVRIDTTAGKPGGTYPSSPGQFDLGRVVADELREIGLPDVELDGHGLLWATVPSNVEHAAPVVALNSHFDTSPETTGKNVQPNVIRDYAGGDIRLTGGSDKVITLAENPALKELIGTTLITTDGTTLLGGDDKAGIAIIVELAAHLAEYPEISHGPIRILFTCDEEIGHGIDHVDLEKLGADVAYTLDGGGANDIDVATFSADHATVTVRGINIHPSIAKDRMVNALRAAGEFITRLPRKTDAPETTEGDEGFFHPFIIEGGVAEITLQILLRDFETSKLAERATRLKQIAKDVTKEFPGCEIDVNVEKSYRNLADGLSVEPRAVALAEKAHQNLGRKPNLSSIRGGTDGSQLTERGLPTPNLSSGQHNPHSPLEWACLDEMAAAVEVLIELMQLWDSEE